MPPSSFFFFNDTATTEIYTLSLHDALPIWLVGSARVAPYDRRRDEMAIGAHDSRCRDRKSTRLNSSHRCISYAVFCLKKKKDTAARHESTPARQTRNSGAEQISGNEARRYS